MKPRALALILTAGLLLAACGDDDDTTTTQPTEDPTEETTDDGATEEPTDEATEEPTEASDDPVAAALADAQDRWQSAGIADYEMGYDIICFCPLPSAVVTVVGGEVTAIEQLGDGEATEYTVEGIFGLIDDAIAQGAARVDATYDDADGHPVSVYIDYSEQVADEETGLTVTSFIPA